MHEYLSEHPSTYEAFSTHASEEDLPAATVDAEEPAGVALSTVGADDDAMLKLYDLAEERGSSKEEYDPIWRQALSQHITTDLRRFARSACDPRVRLLAVESFTANDLTRPGQAAKEVLDQLINDPLAGRDEVSHAKQMLRTLVDKVGRRQPDATARHAYREFIEKAVDDCVSLVYERVMARLGTPVSDLAACYDGYFCAVIIDGSGMELPCEPHPDAVLYKLPAAKPHFLHVWFQSTAPAIGQGCLVSMKGGVQSPAVQFHVGVDSEALPAIRDSQWLDVKVNDSSEFVRFEVPAPKHGGTPAGEQGDTLIYVQAYHGSRLVKTNRIKVRFLSEP